MPSRKRAQICHGRPAQIGHKRLISRELLHRTLGRIVSSCDESRVFASFFGSPYGALQIPTQRHVLACSIMGLEPIPQACDNAFHEPSASQNICRFASIRPFARFLTGATRRIVTWTLL